MSYIGPFTKEILDACIRECKKKDVKAKLQKFIIDPVFQEVRMKIKPYITLLFIIQLIIVVLLIYIAMKI